MRLKKEDVNENMEKLWEFGRDLRVRRHGNARFSERIQIGGRFYVRSAYLKMSRVIKYGIYSIFSIKITLWIILEKENRERRNVIRMILFNSRATLDKSYLNVNLFLCVFQVSPSSFLLNLYEYYHSKEPSQRKKERMKLAGRHLLFLCRPRETYRWN